MLQEQFTKPHVVLSRPNRPAEAREKTLNVLSYSLNEAWLQMERGIAVSDKIVCTEDALSFVEHHWHAVEHRKMRATLGSAARKICTCVLDLAFTHGAAESSANVFRER